ncbi:sulfate/thiosulfate transporter permease subunit [Pectobacterium betavasculorum]|uniref:Sulfate transport system permease protein CysW n=1 Tax=Pectobacterium betavasculorum TaxID=55207 RepID=A0A093RS40_9GAMM|nr:sulfate/thiosulfate ABC transporter permease CysW [Pectobacterium betavasculorum]KFX05957.1 sulfate/thiosulfate transporter permease subunit [Pectobacterium betavasculorum]
MAEIPDVKRRRQPQPQPQPHPVRQERNWAKAVLIALGVILSLIMLVIPLVSIFAAALSHGLGGVWRNLSDPDMLHAIGLTLLVVAIVVPVNLVFGTLLAWLVTRFQFPGRQLLLTLIDIPFAVSPVVAGLLYLLFYSTNGPVGGWLDEQGLQLMFAWPGIALVTIFVTCPFVVRELVPVMMSQGSQEEEAAVLLGASGWQVFYKVTLPNIRWALLYGVVLTNARAIGEFGAVSVVSGSIRGETYTLPLQVELLHQDYNSVGAFTAAALLTVMAILTLLIKSAIQWRLNRQVAQGREQNPPEKP